MILSAQATDVSVNLATRRLYKVANKPQAILDLGEETLKDYIKTIGLYNNKARNIMETCRILEERHDGIVPRDRAALEALPGVGRKTANVVLNTAFGEPTIAVDPQNPTVTLGQDGEGVDQEAAPGEIAAAYLELTALGA